MQVKEDLDEEKRNCGIQSDREKLCAGFNGATNGLIVQYNTVMNDLLNENYRKQIENIVD